MNEERGITIGCSGRSATRPAAEPGRFYRAPPMAYRLLIAGLALMFVACQEPADTESGSTSISDITEDLVGEWSSARRGDAEGETIIFARDQSMVLRDGNYILRTSAPVPTGGRLVYEVDETAEPARLDFVVQNGSGEQVARIPGIVKVLTDDQVQVCMDPETLTRPSDFNGTNCAVLTKLSGQPQRVQERVVVERQPVYTDAPGRAQSNVAYVNSPGDGFLALRSEPSVRTGYRVMRIPHEASVEVINCRSSTSSIGSSRGRWCQVSYNGNQGWAFDAYLAR
ncbi:hypothetical protein BH23BAC4_BH23BAC4_01230 [soil metagenome]